MFLQPRMKEIDRVMTERGTKIKDLETKMNNVEDEVFSDFCLQIKVDNIRFVNRLNHINGDTNI